MKQIAIDGIVGLDTTTAGIRAALAGAGDVDLRIHSPGGSVYDGIGIHNLLAEHRRAGHRISATIDGLSASAATYIAAAADSIRVPANGVWMVHRPYGMVLGDAGDCQDAADQLDAIEAIMVDGYATRTGRPREAIAAELKAETWFYGEQIVESGYADELIPAVDNAPSDRTAALAFAKGALADAQAKLRSHGETLQPERIAALLGRPLASRAPHGAPNTAPASAENGVTNDIASAQAERERILAILGTLEASDARTITALELAADPHITAETAGRILARMPAPGRTGPSEFEKHMAALGNPPITPDHDAGPGAVDWRSAMQGLR